MALKVALETLDGLDEALQSLYTERDGAFVLDLDGVDSHPDVANLRNAYQAEKSKRQEQGTKLAEALAKLEAKPEPTKSDEAEILRLREALEAERDTWKVKATELEGTVYKLTVENQLDAAIRDAGISEAAFQKAAKVMLKDGVKVVDGKPVFDTDMGPLGLAEYVKRWASSEGKAFVSKPAGGGASGASSASSAAKKWAEMSGAEKVALNRSDPEEYQRRKAAG